MIDSPFFRDKPRDEIIMYAGVRGMFRVLKEELEGSPMAPYLGLGAGYREDKYFDEPKKSGIGAEVFSGVEWYSLSFISFNCNPLLTGKRRGCRYSLNRAKST